MNTTELIKMKQIAADAAIVPYCGDKEGLKKIMECRIKKFQSTFTPNVVLDLLSKIEIQDK